jgi:hypothetical protein
MRVIIGAAVVAVLACAAFSAFGQESKTFDNLKARPTKPVPVFSFEEEGIRLDTINFPDLGEKYITYMCIREFGAEKIRCYIVEVETNRVLTTDITPTTTEPKRN